MDKKKKLIEKSGLSHVRIFVKVIRSAYFGALKRRKYAKNVGVNRSAIPSMTLQDIMEICTYKSH